LLPFHKALKKRKYRLLYSPRGGRKPGPKGPSSEVIRAIVEMKQRNPRYGCPRIAQQINLAFGLDLDKDIVRRILVSRYSPDPKNHGPSWLNQHYYNEHRCHSSQEGDTPIPSDHGQLVDINSHRWKKHRRGLFQLPATA
jgi:hypothetical protein